MPVHSGSGGQSASRGGRDRGSPATWASGMLRWAWTQLPSMRTTLFLPLLLAVAAVPGSLFPKRPANPAVVPRHIKGQPGLRENP